MTEIGIKLREELRGIPAGTRIATIELHTSDLTMAELFGLITSRRIEIESAPTRPAKDPEPF